ncbi:MAG TPA: DUF6580 family putative transport protein [Elusimicrobiota bacterium]|nr:DUF6580 family putative transport protein [Elusimicrobiota bacterium]
MKQRSATIALLIFGAALLRIVPHPWNVSPVAAMALFAGSLYRRSWLAFLVPVAALLASDAVLGFYREMPIVYASFAAIVLIGRLVQRTQPLSIAGGAIAGSVLFFVVTNFEVWLFDGLYPHTASGLGTCYIAAIPFFRNTLLGDLAYAASFFGLFAAAEGLFPSLREPSSTMPLSA